MNLIVQASRQTYNILHLIEVKDLSILIFLGFFYILPAPNISRIKVYVKKTSMGTGRVDENPQNFKSVKMGKAVSLSRTSLFPNQIFFLKNLWWEKNKDNYLEKNVEIETAILVIKLPFVSLSKRSFYFAQTMLHFY